MENALLVLSPHDPEKLGPRAACGLALALKAEGAQRLDLAFDPRHSTAGHHGYATLDDIAGVANTLAEIIFRPILGRSQTAPLPVQPARGVQWQPDLATLSTVGLMFARASGTRCPEDMNRSDGRDLGMVLYLALHGRTPDRRPYDALVFPRLAARAQYALAALGNDYLLDRRVDIYGDIIDLRTIRRRMMALAAPPPGARLH